MSDHIVMFASQGNPPDQQDDVISAGYMKSAYPKAVRLLKEENIQLRRKALFTISELLTNGTSCVQLIEGLHRPSLGDGLERGCAGRPHGTEPIGN